MTLKTLTADQAEENLDAFVQLLTDVVESGAAIGFLLPLSHAVATQYWRSVAQAIRENSRVLFGLWVDGVLVGTAQLDLAMRPNGTHRAEVAKVMVHSSQRGKGLGKLLMRAAEDHARSIGRTTLVLDTRKGDVGERLYTGMGWVKAGEIPQYAQSVTGEYHATVLFYKLL